VHDPSRDRFQGPAMLIHRMELLRGSFGAGREQGLFGAPLSIAGGAGLVLGRCFAVGQGQLGPLHGLWPGHGRSAPRRGRDQRPPPGMPRKEPTGRARSNAQKARLPGETPAVSALPDVPRGSRPARGPATTKRRDRATTAARPPTRPAQPARAQRPSGGPKATAPRRTPTVRAVVGTHRRKSPTPRGHGRDRPARAAAGPASGGRQNAVVPSFFPNSCLGVVHFRPTTRSRGAHVRQPLRGGDRPGRAAGRRPPNAAR